MKHKWEPVGVWEHKYAEAQCIVCGRYEPSKILSADWCDTRELDRFWKELNELNDCVVK